MDHDPADKALSPFIDTLDHSPVENTVRQVDSPFLSEEHGPFEGGYRMPKDTMMRHELDAETDDHDTQVEPIVDETKPGDYDDDEYNDHDEDDNEDDFDDELFDEAEETSDEELEDAEFEPEFEAELAPGSLKEKVRWYQAILRHILKNTNVPLNGRHNDGPTRAAMRELQRRWGLDKVNGYLTVAGNRVLAAIALTHLNNDISYYPPTGKTVTDALRRFQTDNRLEVDGKLGPETRIRIVDRILTKSGSNQGELGATGLIEDEHGHTWQSETGDVEHSGLAFDEENHTQIDELTEEFTRRRRRKKLPKRWMIQRRTYDTPFRWVCYLTAKIRDKAGRAYFERGPSRSFSGVMIGPQHVLTVAHGVSAPCSVEIDPSTGNPKKPERIRKCKGRSSSDIVANYEMFEAEEGLVIPGYNNRQHTHRRFHRKPFGSFPVDMAESWITPEFVTYSIAMLNDTSPDELRQKQSPFFDVAVLKLKAPLGTRILQPKKAPGQDVSNVPKLGAFGWVGHPDYPEFCISVPGGASSLSPGKWLEGKQDDLRAIGYPDNPAKLQGMQVASRLKAPKWFTGIVPERTTRRAQSNDEWEVTEAVGTIRTGMSGGPLFANFGGRTNLIGITTGSRKVITSVISPTTGEFAEYDAGRFVVITPALLKAIDAAFPGDFELTKSNGKITGMRAIV